jgi:glutathione S-transferase
MPLIPRAAVVTTEVQTWTGVHLLFFPQSLCVRKVMLVLALKKIEYTPRRVDMGELRTPWYLGINPRGLVPVLIHDGDVIIESNDILTHLEACFPEPKLIPTEAAVAQKIEEILERQG